MNVKFIIKLAEKW